MIQFAIFTDIDDTLVDRAGDLELAEVTREVRRQATKKGWPLVVVTGISIGRVEQRIKSGEVPCPDIAVCAVGTEIWTHNGGGFKQDMAYDQTLKNTGYNRDPIFKQAGRVVAGYAASKPNVKLGFEQPIREETYKVSLNFFGTEDNAEAVKIDFEKYFPNLKIVTCKEIHHNATLPPDAAIQKYCLDIVPVTKADAVEYLIKKLDIRGGLKAGDSGNDTDMLLHDDPLLGVLVGGHKAEAETAVRAQVDKTGKGGLYTLKNGRQFYIEAGPRKAAQSILHAISLLRG